MLGVRRAGASLTAAASLVAAACWVVPSSRTVDGATREKELRAALGAPNGIVIGFNPATCAFGTGLGSQLEQIARDARLPTLVVLFGIRVDSASHSAARNDLALKVPSVLITSEEATERFGIPEGGTPTLLVLKRSAVVLVAQGSALANMSEWLPRFLGTHAP